MISIIQLILQTLWLFLPALLANLTPPLVKKVPFLDYPVDCNLKFRGQRIFGDHKTFRGVFFGVLVAMLISCIQAFLYNYGAFNNAFRWLSVVDYSQINFVLLGFLLGFGALFGDMVKSFFKRQAKIMPGKPFFPFDQTDFLIGAILFLCIVYVPSWKIMLTLIVLGLALHLTANIIGYIIGVNKSWI